MWSTGLGYFSDNSGITGPEEKRRHRREVLRKTLTHPCIVAAGIGMVLLATQWQLPAFLGNTVKSISSCNTALSMILIGVIMGESGFHQVVNRDVIVYCLIRLLMIPALVMLGCMLCGTDGLVTGVSVVLAAMPMGGTTAILAAKYGCDAKLRCKVYSGVHGPFTAYHAALVCLARRMILTEYRVKYRQHLIFNVRNPSC